MPRTLFVEKIRDIVRLYLDPPERAMVVLRGREVSDKGPRPHAAPAPMKPGQCDSMTTFATTTTLFAALDGTSGRVIGSLHKRHRARELLAFLRTIDSEVPDELDVHLVLDNYHTRRVPAVKRWLIRHAAVAAGEEARERARCRSLTCGARYSSPWLPGCNK